MFFFENLKLRRGEKSVQPPAATARQPTALARCWSAALGFVHAASDRRLHARASCGMWALDRALVARRRAVAALMACVQMVLQIASETVSWEDDTSGGEWQAFLRVYAASMNTIRCT